jgi:hypothetical protein
VAYDSSTSNTVLFGGESISSGIVGDTWLWSNGNWTQVFPTTSPLPRWEHAIAYDSAQGQALMFGGLSATGTYLGDTWAWDGTNWTLKSSSGPTPRIGSALVYDALHSQIVLFGGFDANGFTNDTWVWSWVTNAWSEASPANSPSARTLHKIAYDVAHQQAVLFGGTDNNTQLADTWIWNGTNWLLQSPNTVPPNRYNHVMAFDPSGPQVLMFGGVENFASICGSDTWAWNGFDWTQLSPTTSPKCNEAGGMDYDAATGEILLFGGDLATGTTADQTWLFGNPSAQTAVTVNVPAGIQFTFAGKTYTGSQTINIGQGSYTLSTASPQSTGTGSQDVFVSWDDGGIQSHSVTVGSTALTITGSYKMQYLLTTAASPAAGGSVSPASGYYDLGSLVGVSATASAGYAFAGFSGACSGMGPCSVTMSAPTSVTGNFTVTATQYLLTLTEIPLSEGTITVTNPGPNAPYYNPGSVVQIQAVPNASFEFDYWTGDCAGTNPLCSITMNGPRTAIAHFSAVENWVQLYPATSPSPRVNAAMAYDEMNKYVVMFGGLQGAPGTGATVLGDTWLWDGSSWARQKPVASPSARWGAMTAYDAARGQVVLYGGRPDSNASPSFGLSDTWVWDLANNTWTKKSTVGPPRYEGSMAYDSQSKLVILFGGVSGGTWNDTWGWDGATWTKLNPLTSPSPRGLAAVTFHAANVPGLVLFGGAGSVNSDGRFPVASELNDTWQWSGSNWTQRVPAHHPPTQATPTMAYNAATMETMLFESSPFIASGGQQTWAWDGNDWYQKTPVSLLPNRDRQVVTYDAARNEVLIFGGINYATNRVFNDTWAWLAPMVSLVPQPPAVTRNGNGTYDVMIPLANTGNVPATNVSLTSAAVGGATSNSVSTVSLIDRGSTGSFTVKLQVSSAGAPGTIVQATFSGKFDADGATGIPWTASSSVTLP